ncbi:unnamed protein product (macronuclear) [Paramecium tetraurelia]|uniref:Protein kinase domain-containing protein n=1 Tax=Paramecium tetraurelia TaxID=5888 RepID=A0DIK3_PARTE|nr:uncharacterized protein GSPATT00017227001 [Paramecium tetraurelia]CAK82870.1 unnamed protein product [Paramecium tetraurelia]|eukprot:XP_001450267.1 hypothetical protein (macronuclear) [Paramecium tetraurelia strain d4-2]
MNTNLTQDDDSIEFQKAVTSPYKCPQHLLIINDSLFLSSLREYEEPEETFLIVSEIQQDIQIVISSKFVKRIRYTISNPYNTDLILSSLRRAQQFNDDNLSQVHQYVIQNKTTIQIYTSYANQYNYLQERVQTESRILSNEIKLRSYLYSILEGLKYIHQNSCVHMCIILQNIECHKEEYRQLKISRFETLQEIKTKINPDLRKYLMKTLPHIPPELGDLNYLVQPSFDIFCLGVVIFQMCTCQLPEDNSRTNRLILKKFVSKELANMILLMLDAQADNRPTATTLIDNQWFNI